jgi:hypothetical protein
VVHVQGNRFFENHTPDFALSSPLCISSVHRQVFLASGFCTLYRRWVGPLAEPWLNELAGCSVVCLRGRGRRRRAIISVPPPPSSDDASANAAANDNIGGDWQQGFCCLFVGRLDLSPHVADTDAASEAARELRRRRRRRHPRWQLHQGRWQQERALDSVTSNMSGWGGGRNSDDISCDDAVGGRGQTVQCERAVNDTAIMGGVGQRQYDNLHLHKL